MKISISFFLFVSFFQLHSQTWTQISDFPGIERDDGCSFTIANVTYCGTGVVPFSTLGDFYAFDMNTEQWDTISAMPNGEQRQYASAFSDDNKGYVFGGYNGGFLNDLWQYNSKTDHWSAKDSLPGLKRSGAASFVIGNTAYIIGGKTDSFSALSEVWAYDMRQDTWLQKKDFPFGTRWRSSAAASDSLGYLIFGLDNNLKYQKGLYQYNPTKDTWTKISEFPQGGRNYSTVQYQGGILNTIGGMDSSGRFLNENWSFNLQTKQWKELDSIPAKGRRGGISFHNQKAIYYTTGLAADKSRYKETWKWDITTSIEENKIDNSLKIYPNPTSSSISIDFPEGITSTHFRFSICNSLGKIMSEGIVNKKISSLSFEGLTPGLYFVFIRSKTENFIEKVVRQ